MSQQSLADALATLAASDKGRSETARLRDVIDQVEAALAAGVSRQAILEELHGRGFTMTMRGFETALYRLRKKRKQRSPKIPPPSPVEPDSASGTVSAVDETGVGVDPEPVDAAPAPAPSNPEEVLDSIAKAEQRDQRYDALFSKRPKSTRR